MYERALYGRFRPWQPDVCRRTHSRWRDPRIPPRGTPDRSRRTQPAETDTEVAQAGEANLRTSEENGESGGEGQDAKDFRRLCGWPCDDRRPGRKRAGGLEDGDYKKIARTMRVSPFRPYHPSAGRVYQPAAVP